MQTQITCPSCQVPFVADIHQIIDVGREPQLKQVFLSGYLNVVQCPNCKTVTNVATPLLYHDPAHELFMVHVPLEMTLPQSEQEKVIGQLVQRAMDSLPPEQRRGYMFQPQTVLTMNGFVEKILATEGITPEMIARQRDQSRLLEQLLAASKEESSRILEERAADVDATFFAMLRSALDQAESANDESMAIKLTNLQAKLFRETDYGQRLERQQRALHAFAREVKKAGGLTPALLLKHVLSNRDDRMIVDGLVSAGQPAFNYEFFIQLSNRIEKRKKAGVNADELVELREHLLEVQQEIETRSRKILEDAHAILRNILTADDRAAAVREQLPKVDDAFMYVLAANIALAREKGQSEQVRALEEIQKLIESELERAMPPEIRLVNQLLDAESEDDQRKLLVDNEHLVGPELLQFVRAIETETRESSQGEARERLRTLAAMIEARLAVVQ